MQTMDEMAQHSGDLGAVSHSQVRSLVLYLCTAAEEKEEEEE